MSFSYPLLSIELLIDLNFQCQSTSFKCLVQNLCFVKKIPSVKTYYNVKNNMWRKKNVLKSGHSAGLGVFGLNWNHYHNVHQAVSVLWNKQYRDVRTVRAWPCQRGGLPELIYLVSFNELFHAECNVRNWFASATQVDTGRLLRYFCIHPSQSKRYERSCILVEKFPTFTLPLIFFCLLSLSYHQKSSLECHR